MTIPEKTTYTLLSRKKVVAVFATWEDAERAAAVLRLSNPIFLDSEEALMRLKPGAVAIFCRELSEPVWTPEALVTYRSNYLSSFQARSTYHGDIK